MDGGKDMKLILALALALTAPMGASEVELGGCTTDSECAALCRTVGPTCDGGPLDEQLED